MKVLVFLEHDIICRHFVMSGALRPLVEQAEVRFVFPDDGGKRVERTDAAELGLDAAELGRGVTIGPFCHVGPQVSLGDGVVDRQLGRRVAVDDPRPSDDDAAGLPRREDRPRMPFVHAAADRGDNGDDQKPDEKRRPPRHRPSAPARLPAAAHAGLARR